MSDENLEELDPSLASLFGDERTRAHAPPGTKARVFRRLETSIGAGFDGDAGSSESGSSGGGVTSAAVSGGRLLPLLGAFVVGGALGGAVASQLVPPRVVYVERPAASPATSSSVSTVGTPAASPVPSAAPAAMPAPLVSASAGHDFRGAEALAKERLILDVARTALGRGDGARSLEAVEQHARDFPRGQMSEEREAIAVQALAKLGRGDEAAARGARFRKRWPDSVLAPVIDAALAVGAGHPDGGEKSWP